MKNRTVLARLAALGMSVVLCFGLMACGEEKEDSSDRSRTEKDADEEEDEKEEESKEDETKEDESKEEEDKKENTDAKEETSGKDEARAGSGKTDAAQSGKEERTPAVSDGEIAGHYVSTVDLGEEYFLEQMAGAGEMGDLADLFKGADFSFESTLDLKADGTGVIGFDLETFYGNMYNWMDKNYIDMMKAAFVAVGYSEDDLLDMLKQEGYKSLDDALQDYKEEAMEEFEKQMRENSNDAANARAELTWEEDGDTVKLINEEGNSIPVARGADGSLTMTLSKDNSPTGTEMELVFKK